MRKEHKSKAGGLTAAGRAYFKRRTGANLKPPVTESKPTVELKKENTIKDKNIAPKAELKKKELKNKKK